MSGTARVISKRLHRTTVVHARRALEHVTDVGSQLGEGPLWNEPEHGSWTE
jgi:hypothetical protein